MNAFAIILLFMLFFCTGVVIGITCPFDNIVFTQLIVPLFGFGVCAIFARTISSKLRVEEMGKMSDTHSINYTTIPRKDGKNCGNCTNGDEGYCCYAGEIGNHYCDKWSEGR